MKDHSKMSKTFILIFAFIYSNPYTTKSVTTFVNQDLLSYHIDTKK